MADQSGHNGGSARDQDEFARVALKTEEGPYPRMRLSQVHMRLGSHFISVWWLVPGVAVAGIAAVVAVKLFIGTGPAQSFIRATPCVPSTPHFSPGVPGWVIVTHLVNFILLVGIIRAGWQILADHPRLYRKIAPGVTGADRMIE